METIPQLRQERHRPEAQPNRRCLQSSPRRKRREDAAPNGALNVRVCVSYKDAAPRALPLPWVVGATTRSEPQGPGAGAGGFWFHSRPDGAGLRAFGGAACGIPYTAGAGQPVGLPIDDIKTRFCDAITTTTTV